MAWWFEGQDEWLINHPLCRLRELSVNAQWVTSESWMISGRLAQGGSPSSVSFSDCRMPYSAQNYRGLTVLRIMYRERDMESQSQLDAYTLDRGSLTEVLQACPNLEELVLRWPPISLEREPIFHSHDRTTTIIPLFRLRRLSTLR